MLMLTARNSP